MPWGRSRVAVGLCVCVAVASVGAQEWSLIRPSNTGIPGEEVRTVDIAPDGTIWVGARWPFWGEGGIGVLDRATGIWGGWSNADPGTGEPDLPTPLINDVEFAPDGSAWVATDAGLLHYDGDSWSLFNAANTPMVFDRVLNLSVAPNGSVWVNNSSSRSGGDAIYRFDGSTWTRFRAGIEMPWDTTWTDLSDVFVSRDGHVWVANEVLSGIAEYDGQSWVLHDDPNRVIRVEGFVEDALGNIWMHGNPVGNPQNLYRWDGSSFAEFFVDDPTELAVDPDSGDIYAGTWNGTILRSTDNGASFSVWVSGLNQVFNIAPDPAGEEVWVGTIGAVGRFDASGQILEDWNSYSTGMPDYFLDDLKITHINGKILVVSPEAGVSVFDGQRWDNVGSHNHNIDWPVLADGANGAYEDILGNIWIGTNGVARWNPQEGTFTLWDWRNAPFGVTTFVDFEEAPGGEILAFSDSGLVWRFADGTHWVNDFFIYSAGGFPDADVDSSGTVWICGWFDLAFYDGTRYQTVELPYNDFLFDLGGANTMGVAPDDTIWIGTPEGLVRYDGATWTVFDATNTPMVVDKVTGVAFRDDGLMALALSDLSNRNASGMAIVDGDPADPASWTIYTHGADPIPHPQINDVAFDAGGDVWLSCVSEAVTVLHIGGCVADLTGDGVADSSDFFAYLDLFAQGC